MAMRRSATAISVRSEPNHGRCRQTPAPGPTNWARRCADPYRAARLNLNGSAPALGTLLNRHRSCPTRERPASTQDMAYCGRKYVQVTGAWGMESTALVRAS